ncbi:GNAT family N-acetyltransferase [Alicyclobacillus dauci]|uniref:GNAT family N-acetyltransferase n=1 Tax=Alicyclobacillus dauci TaxID=1475485 RepID=A0ABY6Z6Y5_9BACL|nr:GNAT family N-acetyltransferase [Alicyclobacillus dauci]WAH38443.1 GNAT family N-acetyltransferase [Alicyclobacillus dauci]
MRYDMLETDRLRLRPYRLEDFRFYVYLWQDPDVVRYIGNGQPRSKADLKANYPYWVSKSELGKGILLMELRDSCKPVGHAGLLPQVVDGQEQLEIGYWVAKEHWGKGYASETAALCRDVAFKQLGVPRVISIIQPENIRSIRVAEKTGMRFHHATEFHGIPVHIFAMENPF